MVKIELVGLEFFFFFVVYTEEQQAGINFVVDLAVEGHFNEAVSADNLAGTIDYEKLYAVVAAEMQVRSKLLEHVAGRILNRIVAGHPEVKKIKVSIAKLNPPINGKCRATRVSIVKEF